MIAASLAVVATLALVGTVWVLLCAAMVDEDA